mmetsp:Transcript_3509/g.8680  ORF Transcript_3509/g.8680 Transcript_3509/m.8680 type:complete len:343 (+) Transcript_3509:148-1176(+)
MGKWITLVPDKELLFDVAKFEGEKVGDRSTSVDMKIQNNDPARQVFIKIKTTKPSNYHVKPSAVAIEPGASATIKVAFLEKAFLSGTAAVKAKKEDKFLVQAMGETEAVREQNLLEAARKNAILKLEAAQKVAEAAAQKEVDEAGDPQEKEAAQKKKAALSLGKVGDPEEKDVMGELWSLLDKLPEVSKDKLMCRTVGKYSELGNMGGAIRGGQQAVAAAPLAQEVQPVAEKAASTQAAVVPGALKTVKENKTAANNAAVGAAAKTAGVPLARTSTKTAAVAELKPSRSVADKIKPAAKPATKPSGGAGDIARAAGEGQTTPSIILLFVVFLLGVIMGKFVI